MRTMLIAASVILGSVALAAEPPAPVFTTKPTATRAGDPSTGSGQGKVKIEFAVDRETDVAVFVEDGAGKVVRHLVAGVLGKNPPAPLKPGLAQSIEWDGKADYGKPLDPRPPALRVRVALGLGARYDKVLLDTLRAPTGGTSIGVSPDGTLYVVRGSNTFGGSGILAFDRNGEYRRTVMPYPSSLPAERVRGLDTFELDGRPAPLPHNGVMGIYPAPAWGARKYQMAVSSDGRIFLVGGKMGKYSTYGLSSGVLHSDGACPEEKLAVPLKSPAGLEGLFPDVAFLGLALSGDEKSLYVSNLCGRKGAVPAVFRIALPERNALETFFGDPASAGKSEKQLGTRLRGLAVDGKGHLLIADQGNDRIVVVNEADGRHVADIAVDKPDSVAVDRATGCVYVTCFTGKGSYELQKLSPSTGSGQAGWKDARVVARMQGKWGGNPSYPPVMALDASARPPIVWIVEDNGRLLRVEDLGDKLGDAKSVCADENDETGFMDISVDRFRDEVYMRGCGRVVGSTYWWYRYDEAADKLEQVKVGPVTSSAGCQLVAGPDGTLYATAYRNGIFKFGRDGKPSPWENPIQPPPADPKSPWQKMAHRTFMCVSEGWMMHALGVRPSDGHIMAFQPGRNGNRPPRMLREYLPDGQLAREDPIIWKVSDGSVGPKFDQEGNIYVADIPKPADEPYPPEFVKLFGKIELEKQRPKAGSAQDSVANRYGSIIKFSPKGGMVHVGDENPYKGEPKLDASLKTEDYASYSSTALRPVKVTGAQWVRMGCSPIFVAACTCDSTRFDVDEFGRVWYPDAVRFRVCVLDTNGNDLAHFGGYGNADNRGPESKDKALATPDIAFSWLVGVGVTDRYVYTGDSLNRRMLRCRVTYAAEETCPVR